MNLLKGKMKAVGAVLLATAMVMSNASLATFAADPITSQTKESISLLPYLNTNLSFEERAADLVSRMTPEEKQSQMIDKASAIPRLGVRSYNWWSEALHGVARSGPATSFPTGIAMASSWDPEMMQEIGTITSDEARGYTDKNGKGLSYWSPTINLARDPRWGRNEETYGEDPYLTGELAKGFITGMQGDDEKYLKTITTAKHFLANNSEFNRHNGTSDMDARDLREYYLYAFQESVEEGKVESIMTAYNRVNGVPMSANAYILDDIVRKTWGFDGYVVTDCGAISDIYNKHRWDPDGSDGPRTAVNQQEAIAYAIEAGTDLNCGFGAGFAGQIINAVNANVNTDYVDSMFGPIEQGTFTWNDVDEALTRLFTSRMRTGEFDPVEDVPYNQLKQDQIEAADHQPLALESSEKAVVLLKNEPLAGGEKLALPLDASKMKSIVTMGDFANSVVLGDYSGSPTKTSTPHNGVVKEVQAKNPDATVTNISVNSGGSGTNSSLCNIDYFEFFDASGKSMRRVEAESAAELGNMQKEDTNLGYIKDESWAKFTGTDTTGVASVKIALAAANDCPNSIVELRYGSLGGPIVAKFEMSPSGSWQSYVTRDSKYTSDGGYVGTEPLYIRTIKKPITVGLTDEQKETIKAADAILMFQGTAESESRENVDRSSLEMNNKRAELISTVAELNPNVIVYLQSVGIVDVETFKNNVPAILWTSYNGQAQGEAAANILFGDVSPSAKLPCTWYADINQLPGIGDYTMRGEDGKQGRTYQYFTGDVSYPFGHGLSYSNFELSNMAIADTSITPNDKVNVTVDVTNTGSMEAAEVVQMYVTAPEGTDGKRPIKQLKGFDRVSLKPGETKTATIELDASNLYFWDTENEKQYVPAGEYSIQLGTSSEDAKAITQTVDMSGELDTYLKNVNLKAEGVVMKLEDADAKIVSEVTAAKNDQTFFAADELTVSYKSSNTDVAVVDENGVVTPKGVGTALITADVTADGKTESDSFPVSVQSNIKLSSIEVDGTALAGFNADTYEYICTVDENATAIPQITATAPDGMTVSIEQASELLGKATITVTSNGFSVKYVVQFKALPKLKNIMIDGNPIAEFSPDTYSYRVQLPNNFAEIPEITVEAEDGMEAVITQATMSNRTATIILKDGTSRTTYTVKFVEATNLESIDFTTLDSLDGTGWTIENANMDNIALDDRGLTISSEAGDWYQGRNDAKNIVTYNVTGDWSVVTEVSVDKMFGEKYQQAAIAAYQDPNNYVKIDIEYTGGVQPVVVQFASEQNGGFSPVTKYQYTGGNNFFLKLEKVGNTYSAAYSTDGVNFASMNSTTVNMLSPKLGLTAFNNVSTNPIQVSFKNVTVDQNHKFYGNQVVLSDISNLSGKTGTTFTLPVQVSEFAKDPEVKAIEGVVTIPDGVKVTKATPAVTLPESVEFDANADGQTLRFAFVATDKEPITFNGGVLMNIELELTEDIAPASTLVTEFTRFRVKGSETSTDFDLSKAKSTATIAQRLRTASASELFTGDGTELIPVDKKAVSVIFTGLTDTSSVVFEGETFYYNPQRSAVNGQVVYVGLVGKDVSLDTLNVVESYTIADTGRETFTFGDTNDKDGINAQDALNVVSAWLRKTSAPDSKGILAMNVTADELINTADAIDIVDHYINTTPFKVVIK